jgi:two-component system phosphate regulon response regulator OmpR
VEGRILVVDDDLRLQKLLGEYLEGYGFEILRLTDGLKVVETIRQHRPDIVVLDIMLPGRDGLEVLSDIRTASRIPVIMLTAKGEETDRIVGLELGADDYLPKPFNPRELLARIRAVLRRAPGQNGGQTQKSEDIFLEAGGLKLNTAKRTLLVEGEEVKLSLTEYKIMEAMISRPETVFTRDELLDLARGRDFIAFDRSVDVHISNLRAKLKGHPRFQKVIKTVWGSGYMLVKES